MEQIQKYQQAGAKEVLVVGGPGAVSTSNELKFREIGLEVRRIGGANRYETASAIALLWEKSDVAVVANGQDEASYMEGYRQAVSNKAPLLLTGETLPESTIQTLQALGVKKVMLGPNVGSSAISKLREMGVF